MTFEIVTNSLSTTKHKQKQKDTIIMPTRFIYQDSNRVLKILLKITMYDCINNYLMYYNPETQSKKLQRKLFNFRVKRNPNFK